MFMAVFCLFVLFYVLKNCSCLRMVCVAEMVLILCCWRASHIHGGYLMIEELLEVLNNFIKQNMLHLGSDTVVKRMLYTSVLVNNDIPYTIVVLFKKILGYKITMIDNDIIIYCTGYSVLICI